MKTRCLIVDDEPLAIEVIERFVHQLGGAVITGTARNATEAFRLLEKEEVDLLFLDIEMPDLNGITLLKSLRSPPQVIITTAYREYALEGYDLDVVDYLLKPIAFERFLQAMAKFNQRRKSMVLNPDPTALPENALLIRADRKYYRIPFMQIQYIEGMKDYVQIHTDQQVIVTKMTVHSLMQRLPADRFVRLHRSFIVAVDQIQNITKDHVQLTKRTIPIGRYYRQQFQQVLGIDAENSSSE